MLFRWKRALHEKDADSLNSLLKHLDLCKKLRSWLLPSAITMVVLYPIVLRWILPASEWVAFAGVGIAYIAFIVVTGEQDALIKDLATYEDARAIPWLLDSMRQAFHGAQPSDWLMETVSRLLFSIKPDDISVITATNVQYFNQVLAKDYRNYLELDLRFLVSKRLREQYFARQLTFRLGILNVIPLVGNERSLQILYNLLKQGVPELTNAIQLAIPVLEERLRQVSFQETLLRPSQPAENNHELLRPLIHHTEEKSELLLRVAQSEEEIPQRASHGTESQR